MSELVQHCIVAYFGPSWHSTHNVAIYVCCETRMICMQLPENLPPMTKTSFCISLEIGWPNETEAFWSGLVCVCFSSQLAMRGLLVKVVVRVSSGTSTCTICHACLFPNGSRPDSWPIHWYNHLLLTCQGRAIQAWVMRKLGYKLTNGWHKQIETDKLVDGKAIRFDWQADRQAKTAG